MAWVFVTSLVVQEANCCVLAVVSSFERRWASFTPWYVCYSYSPTLHHCPTTQLALRVEGIVLGNIEPMQQQLLESFSILHLG